MTILLTLLTAAVVGRADEFDCVDALAVRNPLFFQVTCPGHSGYFLGARRGGATLETLPADVHRVIEVVDAFTFETRPPARWPGGISPRWWLSAPAWRELRRRLSFRGVRDEDLGKISTGLAYHLLTADPRTLGARLDDDLRDFAKRRGAPVKALESASDQQRLLDEVVRVRDLEDVLARRENVWIPGEAVDGTEDAREELDRLRAERPEAYRRLVIERNRGWFPKLERTFRLYASSLTVVGLHQLIGPDGLLALFAAKGCSVHPELK